MKNDVSYLDTIRCYLLLLVLIFCVLLSIFFEIFLSEVIFHPWSNCFYRVRHLLLLRNDLFVLARRTTAIFLWAKPLDCEKLNKRDFNLLYSQGFFAFLNLAYDRDFLSPDLFSHGSRSSTNRSDLLNSLVSDTHNTCFVYRKASLEVAKHEVQPQLDGRTLAMDNTGIILSSLVSLSQSKASKEASFTASSPYQRASTRLWSTLTT